MAWPTAFSGHAHAHNSAIRQVWAGVKVWTKLLANLSALFSPCCTAVLMHPSAKPGAGPACRLATRHRCGKSVKPC